MNINWSILGSTLISITIFGGCSYVNSLMASSDSAYLRCVASGEFYPYVCLVAQFWYKKPISPSETNKSKMLRVNINKSVDENAFLSEVTSALISRNNIFADIPDEKKRRLGIYPCFYLQHKGSAKALKQDIVQKSEKIQSNNSSGSVILSQAHEGLSVITILGTKHYCPQYLPEIKKELEPFLSKPLQNQ